MPFRDGKKFFRQLLHARLNICADVVRPSVGHLRPHNSLDSLDGIVDIAEGARFVATIHNEWVLASSDPRGHLRNDMFVTGAWSVKIVWSYDRHTKVVRSEERR